MTVVKSRPEQHQQTPRRWRSSVAFRDGLALALVLLLAIALNWQSVFSRDSLPAGSDVSDLWVTHWGNAAFLKQAAASTGTIPLWNPYTMSGRPFDGDPLAAIFYPPMELVQLLPLRTFFLVLLVGHLALAGAGMYALARRGVRLGIGASLFAALAFMWSSRLIGHYGAGHVTFVLAAAWLPWVALGVVLAIRERAIWVAPAGLAFGLAILAGHPQVAFYHGLMIGALGLGGIVWAVARERVTRDRVIAALRVVAIVAATGTIGALIGAALIVPALEFTRLSLRDNGLVVTDRLAIQAFLRYLFVVPMNIPTPHEVTFAPGIAALFLAPLGFLRRPRLAAGLLLAVLTAAVLSLGARTPVMPFLAAHVPGFGYFRAPARIWLLGTLALAVLGALGLQALPSGRRYLRTLIPMSAIALLGLNLWLLDMPLLHVQPAGPRAAPSKLEAEAARQAGDNRIYGVERNIRQAILPDLGIDLADGQDPLQIAAYARFMQLAGGYQYNGYAIAIPPFEVYDTGWPTYQEAQPDARLLGLLNVGVVLSRYKLNDTAFVQVGKVDDILIYRNNAVLPRAFLVSGALGESLARADITELARDGESGIVTPDPAAGQVSITGIGPDGLAVRVDARQAAYLIVGDSWFPGWEARIDGRSAPVSKIGGVIQGVAVPAGTHTVELVYQPLSVRIGLLLSVLGLTLAAAWIAWFSRRARRVGG